MEGDLINDDSFSENVPSSDKSVGFLGWSTTPNASQPDGKIVVGKEPMDVYGVWEDKALVVFHANNDNAYMDTQEDEEGNTEYIESLEEYFSKGGEIDKWYYSPRKKDGANINFLGWSKDPNATKAESSIRITGSAQVDLYAVWQVYYVVTYNANGGYFYEGGDTYTLTADKNSDFYVNPVMSNDPFKNFDGWYDAETGGKKYTEEDKITGDLTVYAHWKDVESSEMKADTLAPANSGGRNVYTFTPAEDGTYAFNSAEGYDRYPKASLYDSSKNLLAENAGDGYNGNFLLICELKAGQTYTLVSDPETWGNADYKIIVRKIDACKVTYDANHEDAYFTDDEDNHVSTITKVYSQKADVSDDIEASTGSDLIRFAGWSTGKNATEADGEIFTTGSEMTLYGVWDKYVSVTFHSNNEDIYYDWEEGDPDYDYQMRFRSGAVIDRDYGHEFSNTSEYTFLGWSTREGATEAEDSITITEDITDVYAVWKKKSEPTPQGDVIPIALNEVKTVNYEGSIVRFSFVPEEDGTYVFESSNNSNDPYAILYDANQNEIARNDDGGSNNNFRVVDDLEKGATYYLYVREYSSERTGAHFDVTVTKPAKYTVTFHANDSTAAFYNDDDVKRTEYEKTYLEGSTVDLSEGFSEVYLRNSDSNRGLAGWATSATAAQSESSKFTVKGDMDLYAVWNSYVTVRFNVNSDTMAIFDYNSDSYGKTATGRYAEGQVISNYAYDDFRNIPDGKVFMGWATSADATKPANKIIAAEGLELYAVWNDLNLITFDANGGFFNRGDFIRSKAFGKGELFEYYSKPSWIDDSKVFVGWATTADATTPDVYEEEPVDGLDTVYAVWADSVTVTYDANGGFIDWGDDEYTTYTGLFGKNSKFISYYAYYSDESYRFAGWYTAKEGGEPVYGKTLTEDMTVYAHWEKTHAVTLHANGGYFGTAGVVEKKLNYSDNEVFYLDYEYRPESADENKVFVGWATTSDAETPNVIPGYTTMKGITDVYAIWDESITITLHANGGYFDEDTSSTTVTFRVKKGSTLESIADEYTADNADSYKRDGGKRARTATGAVLSNDTVFNSNAELYVVWTDLVDLTYDAQDGYISGEGSGKVTIKVAKNESWDVREYTAASNDENIGFVGWSTTPNGKVTVNTVTPGASMTLYAVYAEGPKVTLVSTDNTKGTVRGYVNGENINQTNNTFVWAKGVKLKDLDIYGSARDGYIFMGFSTTEDEKDIVSGEYEPAGITTLYAIFVPGYYVEFNAYPGFFESNDTTEIGKDLREGSAIGGVETPVYYGHVLVGWRDNDAGITILPKDIASYVPTTDTYLTAIWEEMPDTTVHATGVTLNKTSADLEVGKTLQLAATVAPSNATDKTVTWSTSNKAVAVVSAKGLVTTKGGGTAVITATTKDGAFKASCKIRVFGKSNVYSGNTYTLTSLKNKTVTFSKAKNAATVTVPATMKINGVSFKVTQVGSKAFSGKKIKTITIGTNVTTVNAKAFTGVNITKVTIGKNVSKIKAQAFYGGSKGKKLAIILKTAKLTKASTFKNFLKGTKAKTVTITVNVGSKAKNKKTLTAYKKIFTKTNAGFKVTLK